ncbi:MAG: RND transporter [Planctomycetes bacterium]|nr:RND transporter [Planctomycetota bacterium]
MKFYLVLTLLGSSLLLFSTGCDQAGGEEERDNAAPAAEEGGLHGQHDGWWCGVHGIVEKECSMCNKSFAKECREKDDWCEIHTRAASQCFKCNPQYAEKYAKLFRIRFGKEPPPWKE